jgi:hypothetical protein
MKIGSFGGGKKVTLASGSLNKKIERLLALAANSPIRSFAARKSEAKLYELVVLARVLEDFRRLGKGYTSKVQGKFDRAQKQLYLPGAPCWANRGRFSYFELCGTNGTPEYEVWVSLQISTLSYKLAGQPTATTVDGLPMSGRHEIDVGVFEPLDSAESHPNYARVRAGFSCKHFAANKESVREALGLRRELGTLVCLSAGPNNLTPWLLSFVNPAPDVPCEPQSPLFLVSSSVGIARYQVPVDTLGLYMSWVPFPR